MFYDSIWILNVWCKFKTLILFFWTEYSHMFFLFYMERRSDMEKEAVQSADCQILQAIFSNFYFNNIIQVLNLIFSTVLFLYFNFYVLSWMVFEKKNTMRVKRIFSVVSTTVCALLTLTYVHINRYKFKYTENKFWIVYAEI